MSDWSDTEENGVILFSSATDLNGEIALLQFKIKESDSWEEIPFTCRAVLKNGEQEIDVVVVPTAVRILCDHIWDEETFTQAPTCSWEGRNYRRCTICGEEETLSILDKLPHTPGDWITDVEATVNGSGLRHKNCTVCGEKVAEEQIPALEECDHIWGEETFTQDPTCSQEGRTYRRCTICGEEETLSILDKLPHTPGDWITDVEATVNGSGLRHKSCTVCGEKVAEEQIPVLEECAHVWSEEVYLQTATCNAVGYVYRVCLICNAQMKLYEIGKVPHSPGEWIADPSGDSGVLTWHRECSECGEVVDAFSTAVPEGVPPKLDADIDDVKDSIPPWLVGVIAGVAGLAVGMAVCGLIVFLVKRCRT